ncbi:MAG: c-type cytochrome [Elusimicrobia bacterium]|nr:c-type cytochrome [Elusimicrobiota bacterium]
MKRGALAVLVAGLAACSPRPPTGPAAGKAYFSAAGCATCHRIGADGGRTGPDLTTVGFRRPEPWLERWLKDPRSLRPDALMPDPRLSDGARAAIAAYLATLRGQDWPSGGRPWDDAALTTPAARGRILFARAGCLACHGRRGSGRLETDASGGRIPALTGLAQTYTPAELVDKIRRGGPGMPAWGEVLDARELDDVAAYLLTLGPRPGAPASW